MSHPLESPALWARLDPALDAVLELPEPDRSAWLARCAESDPELYAALLEVLTRDPALFASTALTLANPLLSDQPDPQGDGAQHQRRAVLPAGTRVGPYAVERTIGEGGMGTVFLARRADGHFTMPVALKRMRADVTGNPAFLRRFVAERQLLAQLTHPNIARLLDGGVGEDGHPYFVMEYVEGRTLLEHANSAQLSVTERVTCMLQVCAAVQAAHEQLVVHRDLKPSNILVTADGTVKLLDFGVAKLVDASGAGESAASSDTVTMLVTPSYASPEQLAGDPVTTRSDVYALGVVLYELLTGTRPVALRGVPPHRWHATVSTATVPPASRVAGRTHGISPDLDAVLAMALATTPDARYASAEAFADDLRRVLAHRPVRARPATAGYRLQRYVARHRTGVALAAGTLLMVLSFLAITLAQARRIEREAALALVERDRAERVSTFLLQLFGSLYPYGTTSGVPSPSRLLDSAVVRVERDFADLPADAAELLGEISRAYFGVGDWSGAVHAGERALVFEQARLPLDSLRLAGRLQSLGALRAYAGGGAGGEAELRESLAIFERAKGDTARSVARTLNALGVHLVRRGFAEDAEPLLRRALAMDTTRRPFDARSAAQSHRNLAHALAVREQHDEALAHYTRALALQQAEYGAVNADVANEQLNVGLVLHALGQRDSARLLVQHALSVRISLLGAEHDDIAGDETQYAELLIAAGRTAEARERLQHALTIQRRAPVPDLALARTLRALGQLERAAGNRQVGCAHLAEQARIVAGGGPAFAPRLHREAESARVGCAGAADT
jgi:serine/threonine-protein kinase